MSDVDAASVFAAFLEAQDRGERPDFAALCAAHPQFAESLRKLRETQGVLESAIRDMRSDTAAGDSMPRRHEYLRALARLGPPSDRYEWHEEFATGGMGSIHSVVDPLLDRDLAVKRMNGDTASRVSIDGEFGGDDRSLGRFLDEAKITARLDHPYIVPVHDIGIDDSGRVFFAMKRVRGSDLRFVFECIHRGDSEWSMTRGIQVLLKVCEAMAYAHTKGVIHRDLKPGNVMVGAFGEVYVMDWGLAREIADAREMGVRSKSDDAANRSSRRGPSLDAGATMEGDIIGTPAYMPREQAEGNLSAIGYRSDVYAVGAMLYHLVAGIPPYGSREERVPTQEILRRVRTEAPVSVSLLAPDAPTDLVAIIEKAMARDPRDRYADMRSLAGDIQAFLELRTVSAHKAGAFDPIKKWMRRNPALATVASLLLVVATIAGIVVVRKNAALAAANVEISEQKIQAENKGRDLEIRSKQLAQRETWFNQLAGVVKLESVVRTESTLYPPWPSNIDRMVNWLDQEASELVALEIPVKTTLSDLESHGVATRADEPHAFAFEDSAEAFLHKTLVQLTMNIQKLKTTLIPRVEQRLDWARRVSELTLHHPNAMARWQDAREAIRKADGLVASKDYAGSPGGIVDLKPQLGLVPIGMNPVTKLWEFYDLYTALDNNSGADPSNIQIPTHKPDGSIDVAEDLGVVLVLLPGGEYLQGSQKLDPNAPNFDLRADPDEQVDGLPVRITIRPFFMARHELTQGQWKRLAGNSPSWWLSIDPKITSLLCPIENVSRAECELIGSRFGFEVPTEAQWEYACRAGSTTKYSFGSEPSLMQKFGNVRDLFLARTFTNVEAASVEAWDDGACFPCRVGSYAPNAFGLYDMHGNVWEWCRDRYQSYAVTPRAGDGLRESPGNDMYPYRGGAYDSEARLCSSSYRNRSSSTYRSGAVGVRFSRSIRNDS